MTSQTLDKIIESNGCNGYDVNAAMVEAVAIEYAASEVRRFAQQLQDQGFCPDLAYSNHVQDCYVGFSAEDEKLEPIQINGKAIREIYITCPRKSSHCLPKETDAWREVGFERGEYFECYIFQKDESELNDADRQLIEWYGNEPDDWNWPEYKDGFGSVEKQQ